jgi:peptide/nickel transport system substrate-binding protein
VPPDGRWRRQKGTKMRTSRSLAVGVFMALLTVTASACSGAGGSAPASGAGGAGGVLSYADDPVGSVSDNFNPFSPNNALSLLDAQFIYDPLLQWDLLKSNTSYPWLGTSYRWSNDGKTLLFNLRHGVTWSDGKPFTSADVAFTFQLMQKYPALNTNGIAYSSVTAPSRYAVEFHFAKPEYAELYYLSSQVIVPQHIWAKIKNPQTYTDPAPVGTGPYVLKSFSPQLVTLAKNSRFWMPGEPKVAEVKLPALESNTTGGLLAASGQLQWGGFFIPDIKTSFIDKNPTYYRDWFPPQSSLVVMILNLARYPFNQLAVRQAISDALDRNQIVSIGEQNEAPLDTTPTGLVLPTQQSFMDSTYANLHYAVNDAAANALLNRAGFKMGAGGVRQAPNGQPMSFTLTLPASYSDWMSGSQVVVQDLRKIGIDVTVRGVSVSLYTSAIADGSYQMSYDFTSIGPSPYYDYSLLNTTGYAPIGKSTSVDPERWDNPDTTSALDAFAATNSPAAQLQAIERLETIQVTQVPEIPLFYNGVQAEWSTAQFTGFPSQQDPYAWPAYGPENEIVVLRLHPRG